ncbi:MAG TPA: SEC-C metal-binding domain-containing protein, partial [Opitutaceae bacterium]|nr:SEC-C metal-binding domain-containing protein [Opitutaceae bacterium]
SVRLQICTTLFRRTMNLQAFENMLSNLNRTVRTEGPADAAAAGPSVRMTATGGGATAVAEPPAGQKEITLPAVTIRRELPKVGRNDPCPCGSGKKYKHCHGA